GRAVRRRQPRDLEPGMGLEHLDETLADNSGSAEDSDWNFLGHARVENSSYTTLQRAAADAMAQAIHDCSTRSNSAFRTLTPTGRILSLSQFRGRSLPAFSPGC